MSTYGLVLIDQPLSEIESHLCALYGVDSLVPVEEASEGDLLVSTSTCGGWTILDDQGSIGACTAVEEVADIFEELSERANAQVRAISVQTGVGYVGILVAENGEVLRQYEVCESVVSIDEGDLPAWDEQIARDPEGAANDLIGFAPYEPPPGLLTILAKQIRRLIGAAPEPSEPTPPLAPMDSDLSKRFGRPMEFSEPVLAIPTQQVMENKHPKAVEASIQGESLVCSLETGISLTLSREEVEKLFLNPFMGTPMLTLKDGGLLSLPDSISNDELQSWLD